MDEMRVQTPFYLEGLLDRGVDVLIYVGSFDWICNWVGNYRMVEALDWYGANAFRSETLKPWSRIKGQEEDASSGLTKSYAGLTFVTVFGAGHMVSLISNLPDAQFSN
jgi:cathepsin A (carboxypeptidase C)